MSMIEFFDDLRNLRLQAQVTRETADKTINALDQFLLQIPQTAAKNETKPVVADAVRNMDCREPGCGKRSRGPRFSYFCMEHTPKKYMKKSRKKTSKKQAQAMSSRKGSKRTQSQRAQQGQATA